MSFGRRKFGAELPVRPPPMQIPASSGLHLRALEPRILLDAAMADTAADAAGLALHSQLADDHAAGLAPFDPDLSPSTASASAATEIVIVAAPDASLDDIAAHIPGGTPVFTLSANDDPFAQIENILSQFGPLDAVHIFAHGKSGELSLGTATLNAESMANDHADHLAGWSSSFSPSGDLLIYGCDFGQGAAGALASSRLAELTGADIASSIDLTGHIQRGGDWDLERQTGEVETEAYRLTDWDGVLADTVRESNEPPIADLRDDLDIQSDKNQAQSFTHNSAGPTYLIDTVELVLYRKSDAVPQTIIVTIRETFNGPVLATGTLNSAELDTAYAWERFTLDSRIALESGTQYVIQVSTDTTAGKLRIGQENADNYLNGIRIKENGDPVPSQDFAFRVIDSDPNTAPALTTPAAQTAPIASTTFAEDDVLAFNDANGNAISVADADGDDMSITLAVDAGTLTVSGAFGSTVSGSGTDTVIVSGPAFAINQTLQSLQYLQVADANSDIGAGGSDISMSLTLDDGRGDANSVVNDTVMIGITPVADSTDDTVATTRDVALSFNVMTGTNGATEDNFENASAVLFDTTQGANGTVVSDSAGNITYTPNSGYTGADSFTYTVRTPDGKGGFISETAIVNVTVSAPNTAPAITSNGGGATAAVNVDENQTAVTTVTASDADLPADTLTYTITGGSDASRFAIDTVSGELTFNSAPDFEASADFNSDNVYEVEVQVDDGNGGSDTQLIFVTVDDVAENTPPVISSNGGGATAAIKVDENQTAVTTVTASDTDLPADTLTYSISGGSDASRFAIDTVSGELTFNSAPDFEAPADSDGDNVYEVEVRVDDGNGGSDTQLILVTIDDVAENTPPIAAGNHLIATENLPFPIDSGEFRFTDDQGDALQSITVTNLSLNGGALAHTGGSVVVTGGMTITAAELADLTFTPANDSTVDATFDYSVNDAAAGAVSAQFKIGFDAASDILVETYEPHFDQIDDNAFEIRDTRIWGQSFRHSGGAANYEIDSVDLVLYRDIGAPLQTLTVHIRETPGGPTLASGTISSVALGLDLSWHTLSLDTPAILNDGQTYFLEIESNSPAGQVYVGIDEGSSYTNGEAYDTGFVKAPGGDLAFRLVAENSAPVITSNLGGATASINADENQTGVNPVTASDADVPGDTLSYAIIGGADAGLFDVDAASGALSFVTAPDFEAPTDADSDGVYEVTVQVDDGRGGTDTQAISITVNDVTENLSTPEDTPLPIAFDDGMGGTWTSVTFNGLNLQSGTLTHSGGAVNDGDTVTDPQLSTLQFAPAPNSNASVSFGYTINDAGAGGASGVLNIDVTPVNDVPVASGKTVTTAEDTAYVFSASDFTFTDVEGDALQSVTVDSLSLAGGSLTHSGGSVTVTDGMTITLAQLADLTFVPAGNSNTTAVFDYRVNDADNGVAPATMSIVVTAVNDAPAIVPLTDRTSEDADTVTLDVSGNFTDVDGDPLSFTATGLPDGLSIDAATGVISGTIDRSASRTSPFAVTVTADDANGGSASDAFIWTVTNPTPIGATDSFTTPEDTTLSGNVSTNDSDADGDVLTYALVGDVSNGVLMLNSAGSFIYDPDPGYEGSDSFTYSVTDADGAMSTATVAITVTGVNDAPAVVTPIDDQSSFDGEFVSISFAPNFTDADGDALTYSASGLPNGLTIDPATGVVSGAVDRSASVSSPFAVTISANDGLGGSISDDFIWSVANPAPVALADTYVTDEDVAFGGNVGTNDSDQDNDPLSYAVSIGTNAGTLDFNADGSFTYMPGLDFNGTDGFTYTVFDGEGGQMTASVAIDVTPVNDAPRARSGAMTLDGDRPLILGITAFSFNDVEGDAMQSITVSGLSLGGGRLTHSGGAVEVTEGMTITAAELADLTFTPAPGSREAASFSFSVNDLAAGTQLGRIEISAPPESAESTFDPAGAIPDLPRIEIAAPVAEVPENSSILTEFVAPQAGLTTGSTSPPELIGSEAVLPETSPERQQKIQQNQLVELAVLVPAVSAEREETAPEEPVGDPEPLPAIEAQKPDLGLTNLDRSSLLREMNRTRAELQQYEQVPNSTATNILLTFGTVLTVGSVSWTLRTGSLAAAFLSTLPAWRGFDPIVIAKRAQASKDDVAEPTMAEMMLEQVSAAQKSTARSTA